MSKPIIKVLPKKRDNTPKEIRNAISHYNKDTNTFVKRLNTFINEIINNKPLSITKTILNDPILVIEKEIENSGLSTRSKVKIQNALYQLKNK